MLLLKEVNIDLDRERQRIAKVDYTEEERKDLLDLLNIFESGDFERCLEIIDSWKGTEKNKFIEFIDEEIYRIFIEVAIFDFKYRIET